MAIYEVSYKRWAYTQICVEADNEDEANSIAHEWEGMIDWDKKDPEYETEVNLVTKMCHKEACDYEQEVREGRAEPPKKRLAMTIKEIEETKEREERERMRSQLNGFN